MGNLLSRKSTTSTSLPSRLEMLNACNETSFDLKQTTEVNNISFENDQKKDNNNDTTTNNNNDDDDYDDEKRARELNSNETNEFIDDPLETKLIEEALLNIYSDEIVLNVDLTNESSSSSSQSASNHSKSKLTEETFRCQIKPFLGQKIDEIRKTGQVFVDPYFKPSIKVITENCRTDLFKSLAGALRVANKFDMNELSKRIVWKKSKVIRDINF